MAFMGIMVAGVVLVILLTGLFNLVVGGILTLIWIICAACKKKTHILLKIPATLFLIGGFFL